MYALLGLIRDLFALIQSPEARDQAYLAKAVDHRDLQQRMREIETRNGGRPFGPNGH